MSGLLELGGNASYTLMVWMWRINYAFDHPFPPFLQVGSLKSEVSTMLQDIVVAEAAIIGLEGAMQLGDRAAVTTSPIVSILPPNTATSPPAVVVSPKMVAMPTFTSTPGSAIVSIGSGVKETVAGTSEGVGLNVFSITTVPEDLEVPVGKERPAAENIITATRCV